MARPAKDARDPAAPAEVPEVAEVSADKSLTEMIAEALAQDIESPVHGALTAIETALNDLKRRAESVIEHLAESPILERIKAL